MKIRNQDKIIRSVCLFCDDFKEQSVLRMNGLVNILTDRGYTVQTKRYCFKDKSVKSVQKLPIDKKDYLSIGSCHSAKIERELSDFFWSDNVSMNLCPEKPVTYSDIDFLFRIIKYKPEKTFNFAYTFNNAVSSPYFPSSTYHKTGFSIGLQPCNLSYGCNSLDDFKVKLKNVWKELNDLFIHETDFLGIDSSIAPLFTENGSFVHFLKKLHGNFRTSVTTPSFTSLSHFIKTSNPKPVGLCGLMLPCLEDFELADEYSTGEFNIERNIFLSLHSGLGIDTYPIGVNESRTRVFEILTLIQQLSDKYKKPLSARFVSDGKAAIGDKTFFNNQFLKDVVIRKL